jgi:hypothetical protein
MIYLDSGLGINRLIGADSDGLNRSSGAAVVSAGLTTTGVATCGTGKPVVHIVRNCKHSSAAEQVLLLGVLFAISS